MEGQNNHGLVSVDLAYDDELLHSSGWSAPGDPQYSYPRHTQNQYAGYTDQLHLSQPTYEHFNVNQQATYAGLPYENQSFGTQFRRQPDNFAPTYPVNPSLQNSQAYQTQHRSYFTPQTNENATISPQTLQYNNGGQSHGSVRADPNMGFKTTTNCTPDNYTQRSQESTMYYNNLRNSQLSQNNATRFSTVSKPPTHEENCQLKDIDRVNPSVSTSDVQQAQPIMSEEPTSQLRITRPDLQQLTNMSSRPRFDYAPYVVWEDTPFKITVGLKNTLPKYYPRRTKSGRELVPGFDLSKSLNPAQVSVKKRGSRRLSRELTASTNRSRGTSLKPKILTSKSNTSREDPNSKILNNQPDSGSETESSSESESEYDEEIRTADVSEIRGRNRPTDTAQAARWDTIGLIWKDPNSNPNASAIKDAIEKYANYLIALRLKIKANSTHLENSTRPSEISRIQSERQTLLESLFHVISAAVEHGYDPIVENLGGHHKLVNGLTTTLIECIKADDFNGKLPKAVFSLLSKFKTLTDDLLKKLKFESIQKRWTKKGDEDLKKTIAFILSNTVDARASKAKKLIEVKKLRNKVEPTKARSLETSNSATSSPVKRPHEVDAAFSKPNKKVVSDMANSAAIAKSLVPKRGMSNLLGISTKPVKPPPPKRRDPSPPSESKLGALLASIAKDPDPPRAPELPMRAPETPQEKARRERKESRRHLRVKFKEGSELEEIRQFTHEQAEDEGRRDEMLRHAHDYRLEGIMHRRRVTEAFDDDDDYQPSDSEPLYPEPRPINFDYLEKTTRFGKTYSTRGGDLDVKTDEAKKQERREGLELMVVYTDPEDIPFSPKEPMSLSSIEYPQPESQIKGPTEPWLVKRLQEIEKCGQEQVSKMLFSSNTYKQNNSPEISSVLQKLGETSVQPINRALEPSIDPSAYANLVFFVKYLSGKPFPAIEPPEWMSPEFKASWIEGYNRDLAIKNHSMGQGNNLNLQAQKLATSISMANPSYQHGFQVSSTPFSSVVSQSAYPISLPDVTQQMQNYLATYQARDKYPGPPQAINYNAWNSQIANFQNDQPSTSRQGYPQRWEVARELEGGRSNQQEKTNSKKKEHDNKAGHGPPFEEKVEHKSKKKRRRFWSDGKRNKGRKGNSHHS